MSFDAPVAQFGLGESRFTEEGRIRWVNGGETVSAGRPRPARPALANPPGCGP